MRIAALQFPHYEVIGLFQSKDELLLEQRIRLGELFDVYGVLLTEKQRKSCELLLQGDLSMVEVGEVLGMTRQGAYDLLRRTRDCLDALEKDLGVRALEKRYRALSEAIRENRAILPDVFVRRVEGLLASEEGVSDV